MSSTIYLKPYSSEDKPVLLQLIAELQDVEVPLNPDRALGKDIAEPYLKEILERTSANQGGIVLAMNGAAPVGYVAYYVTHDTINTLPHMYLSDILVTENARQQGVGRVLIAHVESAAKDLGVEIVRLAVLENNPSRRFYEKMGFEVEVLELKKRV